MEPHGELVEGEGCTHAVENGDEATGKEGDGRGVGANLGDEGVAETSNSKMPQTRWWMW